MRFKKIYIEITNHCNLKCEFCKTNVRKKTYISINEFEFIISEIKQFTNYVYFHILGEPLLHKDIDKLIIICENNNIKVNLTTNGTLLLKSKEKLLNKNIKNIHQINISMHSQFEDVYSFEDYFNYLIKFIKEASQKTYINLRLWNVDEKNQNNKIIKLLQNEFDNDFIITDTTKCVTISKNIFLHFDKRFTWPNILSDEIFTEGKCYGLRDQIGILVDGSVVPCCLDAEAAINLGNIYKDGFLNIINSERAIKIKTNFENRKVIEKYCKTCGFAVRNNLDIKSV